MRTTVEYFISYLLDRSSVRPPSAALMAVKITVAILGRFVAGAVSCIPIAVPFVPLFMLKVALLLDMMLPQLLAGTVLEHFFHLVMMESMPLSAFMRPFRIVSLVAIRSSAVT